VTNKVAKAGVLPVRQRTQYSCMAASAMMCLKALGHQCDEDEVNNVMGATPMKGAAWEHALATVQHYGCRGTLTSPATVSQLQAWTDNGSPVMIAWNPEGREWSHASVVFDVTPGLPETLDPSCQVIGGDKEGRFIWVADPNLPNPEKLVRVVHEDDFYGKWYEKWPRYLVRRPAMAIEREITPEGRQVMASSARTASFKRPDGFYLEVHRPMGEDDFNNYEMSNRFDPKTNFYIPMTKEELERSLSYVKRGKSAWRWEEYRNGRVVNKDSGRGTEFTQSYDGPGYYDVNTDSYYRRRYATSVTDNRGHKWDPKRGLEGPFKYKTGVVLYYDPREGKYYDPSTDLYVSIKEFMHMTGEFPKRASSTTPSASRVAARYYEMTGWAPNPHARKYTFETFVRDYYAGETVPPARVARQFWDDFQNAFEGSMDEYIAYTRR
jgi:hypothetical protein